MSAKIQLCVVALMLMVSCSEPIPQKFDSEKWKAGGKSVRGSMTNDVITSRVLIGKTKSDVESLLGVPDNKKDERWSYKIITVPRCHYIWNCYMQVFINVNTDKCIDVGTTD